MPDDPPVIKTSTQFITLLKFYLITSGRLVQRVFLPIAGVIFVLLVFLGIDFFIQFTAVLISSAYMVSALSTTIFLIIIARIASRRMLSGLTGWMRHLPISGKIHKSAALATLMITILPFLAFIALLSSAASIRYHIPALHYLAGLPFAGLAAALISIPVKRKYSSTLLSAISCLCLTALNWPLTIAGIVLIGIALVISGPPVRRRTRKKLSPGKHFHLIIILRSFRLRLLFPFLFSFTVYPFLFLFFNNNANNFTQTFIILRLGLGMGLIIFCASWSQIISARRPPWPWSRSLPETARQRIFRDSLFLFAHMVPILFINSFINLEVFLSISASLPALIFLTVLISRQTVYGRFGIGGRVLGRSFFPLLLFGLSPLVSLFYLLLSPLILSEAVSEDVSLRVSHWEERNHITKGDSLAWREN